MTTSQTTTTAAGAVPAARPAPDDHSAGARSFPAHKHPSCNGSPPPAAR